MRFKITICLLLVNLVTTIFSQNTPVDPSSSGSVFSSLLQSLSSSDRSPNCPGRCFNAIAALACQETLDTPGLCRKTGYRCCKNVAEKETSEVPAIASSPKPPVTKVDSPKPKDKEGAEEIKGTETSITKGIKTLRYSNGETKDEMPQMDEKEEDNQEINGEVKLEEKVGEDENEPQLYSSSAHSVEVCPGVCVAQRISNFCEAVIDVQGLCKPQLRCCVPAKLFDGVDIPPKEFKVLNAAESSNITLEESRSEMTDLPKFETSVVTTPSTTSRETSTERKRSPVTEKVQMNLDKLPLMEEDDGIPPEKRCTGTCIAGFFAFLCDSIDRNRECAGGGKCCIAPRKTKPGKSDKKEPIAEKPPGQSPPSTTKKPKVRTTTESTTPKPRPTTTERETTVEEPIPPPCPGICFPVEIASRCQHPSRLVASSGCSENEICCEEKGRIPVKTPVKSTVSQIPEAFGTILSLFGGGQPEKRPPPPPRRTAPPVPITTTAPTTTTTTTTTTTIPITERPECTGTCISPILSFTCFGNAEMSELFKCSKDKQSCCATKSAIRDLTRQHEMKNIARNDTVFPSDDSYYHLPSTVVRPPHSYQSADDYHSTFYNFASQERVPFKPPPPPPSYQSSIYAQQSFDKPLTEHNNYAPYGQPHHVPPPQQPINQHPHPNAYIKPPHTNPIPPPQSTRIGQLQPHYNHNLDDRQPYQPTQATISQDAASSSSSQVSFLGGSPQVDNKYVCGVKGTNRVARVVGGEDAVPGEWCWQVALINSLNQYLCGGALIGTQWVLTAAHCVTNIVRSGDAIYVRVGDHDLTTRFGSPGAQTLPVATTYIHHNHNSQTLDNDIALLKLSSHAELGNGVCLACLPARGVSQSAGKRCTVTGYGYMGETGPIPLRVREAEIPVVSDNECVRKINAVTEKIFILPASSFCAGGESGHDACQGDGGGPLVCNVDGFFELSGLVSWGFGCGRQDVPGVYVKVSSFIGWVNQIISVNNL